MSESSPLPYPCSIVVIKESGKVGKNYDFSEGRCWCTMGTHKECDIQIQTPGIATLHALVQVKSDGVHVHGLDAKFPVDFPRGNRSIFNGQSVAVRSDEVFVLGRRKFRILYDLPNPRNAGVVTDMETPKDSGQIAKYDLSGSNEASDTLPTSTRRRRSSLLVCSKDETFVTNSSDPKLVLQDLPQSAESLVGSAEAVQGPASLPSEPSTVLPSQKHCFVTISAESDPGHPAAKSSKSSASDKLNRKLTPEKNSSKVYSSKADVTPTSVRPPKPKVRSKKTSMGEASPNQSGKIGLVRTSPTKTSPTTRGADTKSSPSSKSRDTPIPRTPQPRSYKLMKTGNSVPARSRNQPPVTPRVQKNLTFSIDEAQKQDLSSSTARATTAQRTPMLDGKKPVLPYPEIDASKSLDDLTASEKLELKYARLSLGLSATPRRGEVLLPVEEHRFPPKPIVIRRPVYPACGAELSRRSPERAGKLVKFDESEVISFDVGINGDGATLAPEGSHCTQDSTQPDGRNGVQNLQRPPVDVQLKTTGDGGVVSMDKVDARPVDDCENVGPSSNVDDDTGPGAESQSANDLPTKLVAGPISNAVVPPSNLMEMGIGTVNNRVHSTEEHIDVEETGHEDKKVGNSLKNFEENDESGVKISKLTSESENINETPPPELMPRDEEAPRESTHHHKGVNNVHSTIESSPVRDSGFPSEESSILVENSQKDTNAEKTIDCVSSPADDDSDLAKSIEALETKKPSSSTVAAISNQDELSKCDKANSLKPSEEVDVEVLKWETTDLKQEEPFLHDATKIETGHFASKEHEDSKSQSHDSGDVSMHSSLASSAAPESCPQQAEVYDQKNPNLRAQLIDNSPIDTAEEHRSDMVVNEHDDKIDLGLTESVTPACEEIQVCRPKDHPAQGSDFTVDIAFCDRSKKDELVCEEMKKGGDIEQNTMKDSEFVNLKITGNQFCDNDAAQVRLFAEKARVSSGLKQDIESASKYGYPGEAEFVEGKQEVEGSMEVDSAERHVDFDVKETPISDSSRDQDFVASKDTEPQVRNDEINESNDNDVKRDSLREKNVTEAKVDLLRVLNDVALISEDDEDYIPNEEDGESDCTSNEQGVVDPEAVQYDFQERSITNSGEGVCKPFSADSNPDARELSDDEKRNEIADVEKCVVQLDVEGAPTSLSDPKGNDVSSLAKLAGFEDDRNTSEAARAPVFSEGEEEISKSNEKSDALPPVSSGMHSDSSPAANNASANDDKKEDNDLPITTSDDSDDEIKSNSKEELEKMRVRDLSRLLSKHNLPSGGRKKDLISRLLESGVLSSEKPGDRIEAEDKRAPSDRGNTVSGLQTDLITDLHTGNEAEESNTGFAMDGTFENPSEANLSEHSLHHLKKPDLVKLAKAFSLQSNGSKQELVGRLLNHKVEKEGDKCTANTDPVTPKAKTRRGMRNPAHTPNIATSAVRRSARISRRSQMTRDESNDDENSESESPNESEEGSDGQVEGSPLEELDANMEESASAEIIGEETEGETEEAESWDAIKERKIKEFRNKSKDELLQLLSEHNASMSSNARKNELIDKLMTLSLEDFKLKDHEEDSAPTERRISQLNTAELRSRLKDLCLCCAGKKAVLVQRLESALASNARRTRRSVAFDDTVCSSCKNGKSCSAQ